MHELLMNCLLFESKKKKKLDENILIYPQVVEELDEHIIYTQVFDEKLDPHILLCPQEYEVALPMLIWISVCLDMVKY